MRDSNKKITYDGAQIIEALNEIEVILISLHKIGAYYGLKDYQGQDKAAYDSATNEFIDGWNVTQRLAAVRRILSEKFDTTLGDDDMDDLERSVEGLMMWKAPGN